MDLKFTAFNDRVTCCKCSKYFKCPRRLTCSCALCNNCVPRDPANNRFSCPSCLSESRKLQFGNFFLARPEHALATIQQYICHSEVLNCECCISQTLCKVSVVAWCSSPECGFMCDHGLHAHMNMKPLRRHTFYSELQLRFLFHNLNRSQVTLSTPPIQVSRETHCCSHSKEVLNFYCMSCSEILCAEGAENHPDGHDINEHLNVVFSRLKCDENIGRLVDRAMGKVRESRERQQILMSQGSQCNDNLGLKTKLQSWTVELDKSCHKLEAVIKSALNILDWIKVESPYLVLIEYKRINANLEECIQDADEVLNNSVVK
ncbi:uncharacterized protein LOC106173101 isoform X2 [Lingula anatina]|nr:uncharacterized protein LOC106173101 isoform X2 [Lingula anatina]XP_013409556.1 uncharacterized protein LOC106173101 isoform X2 [Lingula anatina]|eukprot:XP_013409555.1 uncharacterized protein LOC106173101 isoform X2 [Lingula anatina]